MVEYSLSLPLSYSQPLKPSSIRYYLGNNLAGYNADRIHITCNWQAFTLRQVADLQQKSKQEYGVPWFHVNCSHQRRSSINWIIKALAISIKKAPTSGTTMNAFGDAPNFLVTAVMLAIAVGVAPIASPA